MTSADDRSDNIRMIRESAAAIVPPGDLARIRRLRYRAPGFDRAVWREICEMGWPGLRLAEAAGGSGLGMLEYCALAEECGAGLLPEPLIACAAVAQVLRGDRLAALLAGDAIVLPAWQEAVNSLATSGNTVMRDGRLSGRKLFVPMAAGADAFLVTTAQGLALVERTAPGVSLSGQDTQDGGHVAALAFDRAPAVPIPGEFAAAMEEATLATAAYLLGVMERAFDMTLDYLRMRQQFGQPIGSFQALQHRAADLKIQIALTRASTEAASVTLETVAEPAVRQAAVSRAKARAAEAAVLVTREAVQMHGAIGYTDEYDAGLYLRKAMVLASQYGSASVHRARFAAVAADEDEGQDA
ncbi:MAG: acyl-CoA dehydrogenase family protein [Rhizobiales bacterium]|nr:acyl-CoA dehydrogenase family protein [Hyphomicrobiales bacterium]